MGGPELLNTLRLVAAHTAYSGAEPSICGNELRLQCNGQTVVGLATVASFMATGNSALLGKTPDQQAQVQTTRASQLLLCSLFVAGLWNTVERPL